MTQIGPMAKLTAPARRLLASLCLLLAALGVAGGGRAWAAQSEPSATLNNTVSLISNVDTVAPGQPFRIGLYFNLGQKWHIYWTNPGDAGAAPTMKVTLPDGGTAGAIQWPVPKMINDGPVTSYGYTRKMVPVLLPLTITPPKTLSDPNYTVTAAASWLVCKNICVPGSANFTLTLPVGATAKTAPEAKLFAAVDHRMPQHDSWKAWIAPDGTLSVDGLHLAAGKVASAQFFADNAGQIDPDYAQTMKRQGQRLTLALKFASGATPGQPVAGVLMVTRTDGTRIAGTISARPGVPPPLAPRPSFWMSLIEAITSLRYLSLIGGALVGGLILNLMPCVFPVLAMKAAHLAKMSEASARHARHCGLAYGAGVLVSFLALGGLLLALRAGGHAIGWGFQFQSPVFVLVMTWLLFAVGLIFSDILQIGGRWMGIGQNLTAAGGMTGSFFSGVLAAVVATPCTAPFMGAAVAAALSGPPLPGLALFLALGIGLALPMVVVSALPAIGRLLPRPGAWMMILHEALAFPIYATVLWLVWVAAQEGGPSLLLIAGGGLILIAFAAWAARLGGRVAPALALVATVALVPLLWKAQTAPPEAMPAALSNNAQPFSNNRLAALRAAGKPAFVNLTAAWCVTCLLNTRVTLDQPTVRRAFRADGVAYLVGDWTNGNPEITAFLKAHGRDGVPLYVYYPPGNRPAVVLPQILTPATVLAAIGGAKSG
jgi:thiol:disulfide interchange protein DsbD